MNMEYLLVRNWLGKTIFGELKKKDDLSPQGLEIIKLKNC